MRVFLPERKALGALRQTSLATTALALVSLAGLKPTAWRRDQTKDIPYENTYFPGCAIKSRIPLTIADSAQPGCNLEDRTSNVYIPKPASCGI